MFFFFNDTATTEIYTLSLHDALPIYILKESEFGAYPIDDVDFFETPDEEYYLFELEAEPEEDRKSTRLNSSHANISYAVFCLKKTKNPPTSQLASCMLRSLTSCPKRP